MKPKKRRIDIRLKKRLFEKIEAIAATLEETYTYVIEEALEYGLNWYDKKLKRATEEAKATKDAQDHKNTKPKTPKLEEDEEIPPSDEETKAMIDALYSKRSS